MECTNSLIELERSLSNSLLNLEASNAELEKFKLEKAQLQAQLESVSAEEIGTAIGLFLVSEPVVQLFLFGRSGIRFA